MPARTEVPDRTPANGHRWRVNSNGQFVNTEAESTAWELADEIGRLKLGESDDVRVPIRTPPRSKISPSAVAQANEASPLDSSASSASSPHVPDHPISHSRGSSADTTLSRDSANGNSLLAHPPHKVAQNEPKERPHSFSGGLSSADLRRLQQADDSDHDRPFQQQQQQQQWAVNQYREAGSEQLSYPSLSNQANRPLGHQMFTYPPNIHSHDVDRDDAQLDYSAQQRNFNSVHPHVNHGQVMNQAVPPHAVPQFVPNRPNNAVPAMNYRQSPRGFPQGGPNPPAVGYPGGHTSHLSLGNTQQLYEMMLPAAPHDHHHPAVTRVQQQHNVFRGTHHHSASDPSAIRDPATLALLNNNLQNFNPGMYQPGMPPPALSMYNSYYGAPELAVQQAMAARLQSQYNGAYGMAAPTANLPVESSLASPTSSAGQTGPSANNRKLGLYKTELCRSWEEKGTCRYGTKCQFAHGEDELRRVSRHPKYKTEICKTFWVSGSCPYGKRCCFIHTELSSTSTPGAGGNGENSPQQPQSDRDNRERSNSDPDTSSSVSLLARISQRSQESSGNTAPTPVDLNATSSFPFTRPPTGSLRVDTSALDGHSVKQNKSAYPSFASNGILLPAPEHITAKSPGPVTAGPDLGRHNLARMEIVGLPNAGPTSKKSNSISSSGNPRHSFSGTEVDGINFSSSPPTSGGHAYSLSTSEAPQPSLTPRVNGHVRAGSAGTWASFSRSGLSNSTTSAYNQHGPSPAGEIMSNSPWSNTELTVGSSRAWA